MFTPLSDLVLSASLLVQTSRRERCINYADGRSSAVGVVASSLKRYHSTAVPVQLHHCSTVQEDKPWAAAAGAGRKVTDLE